MSGWRHPDLGAQGAPVPFTFDGTRYQGVAGDTLASALLAAGVRVLGRSFKYHRPRGLWGAGHDEPNAIFDVTENGLTTPNMRATTTPLRAGMDLCSVNTWPRAARDRLAPLDRLSRFLPAGFYYKTFMRPGWERWEPMIRRMAGLGTLDPGHTPPADIAQRNARCDLMVVGAGPAGLAAARAAAMLGRAVWLIDEADTLGGSLRWRGGQIDGADWTVFAQQTADLIEAAGGCILTGTTVWGAFDHGLWAAWERREDAPDVMWRIRTAQMILAAGAIERPIWCANNDLPGVMSAEAALHFTALYGAIAGRRIALATANDASYPVAHALAAAGADVQIIEARDRAPPSDLPVITGARVTAAHGRAGVTAITAGGTRLSVDTLLCSGGYTPTVHLHCQAGGKLDWDARRDALIPRAHSAPLTTIGAANGEFGLTTALASGHAAGGGTGAAPRAVGDADWGLMPLRPDPSLKGRQWVDLQNDVTLKDVGLAAREGFRSVEHLKRYTTLGMATDQGRSSNFAGLAAMAALTDRTIPQTGTTTYRPPFAPVPLSVIAGRRRGALFNPVKRLTLERAHRAAGAKMREYGGWLRPAQFGDVMGEARAVRDTVGLFDASPLGKLELIGPGAAKVLEFCSYIPMASLKSGRARYGLMLAEGGTVYDDGVVLRMAEDRFVVSASSSHVAGVRMILEEARQDRFDPAHSHIHDVTAHWSTLTVTGPRAPDVLAALGLEALTDATALPHMGVTETRWQGARLRAARVSFTGERSYELSVPCRHAARLHAALMAAVTAAGGRQIGMEAVLILRAEKGFIVIGKDTDGVTQPQDLGWAGPLRRRKDEYSGRRSLMTPEARRDDRRQLVGLSLPGGSPALATGAHLVAVSGARRSLGFVTSSYDSPALGRPIALALLENGRARIGEEVLAFHLGETRPVTITPACAYDPKGERL